MYVLACNLIASITVPWFFGDESNGNCRSQDRFMKEVTFDLSLKRRLTWRQAYPEATPTGVDTLCRLMKEHVPGCEWENEKVRPPGPKDTRPEMALSHVREACFILYTHCSRGLQTLTNTVAVL